MRKLLVICLTAALWSCGSSTEKKAAEVEATPEVKEEVIAAKPGVFFKNINNGDTLTSPVMVQMGVIGMEIEPAGAIKEGFGHHHILINQTSWTEGNVIPMSDSTLHFGKGQEETALTLEPGTYTIALQFADGVHASYGESMATAIEIIVQ